MNNYNKKFKQSDFNFIDTNKFEPYVETNVLIREEAEFLSQNFRNENELEEFENISKFSLTQENDTISNKELKDVINDSFNDFKDNLIEVLPSNETYKSFENSMNSTLNKLEEIVDLLKQNTSQTIPINQFRFENSNTNLFDPTSNHSNNLIDSYVEENDLIASFEKMVDLKIQQGNKHIEFLIDELNQTKNKFNELFKSYEQTIGMVVEKQNQLNNHVVENKKSINELIAAVNINKMENASINDELATVYETWIENNSLLSKLESLIYEIGTSKMGYEDDLNNLLEEIRIKTIKNQENINELNTGVDSLKDKMNAMHKNYEKLAEIHDENIDILKKGILENESNINELKEKNFQTIEKIIDIEHQIAKNRESINDLNEKYLELSNFEQMIDKILSSIIFQKSLEMKISNMITENNNYLGDEFCAKIDLFATNVVSDIDEVRKNNEDLLIKYHSIENKVLEVIEDINGIDKTAEIKIQIEKMQNDYQNLCENTTSKINSSLSILENIEKSHSFNEKDILEIINSSHELTTIIKDKTRQVVNEQLENNKLDLVSIEKDLEEKIKKINNENTISVINEQFQTQAAKIKNESLNEIYKELVSRDEKISKNFEEISKNYQAILECNVVLSNLEKLILRQSEEFDGYKFDEVNSISELIDKISDQRKKVSELEDLINQNIKNFNFHNNSNLSNAMQRGLESWKLEFSSDMIQMVKKLVQEEIKNKNLISHIKQEENKPNKEFDPFEYQPPEYDPEDAQKRSENFFINRVKDILNRLEDSNIQKAFEEKFNITKHLQNLSKSIEEDTENKNTENINNKEYSEFVSNKDEIIE